MAVVAVGAVAALLAVLSRKERTEGKARAFLAGFTYVLSDDPDAAIAELSRAAATTGQAQNQNRLVRWCRGGNVQHSGNTLFLLMLSDAPGRKRRTESTNGNCCLMSRVPVGAPWSGNGRRVVSCSEHESSLPTFTTPNNAINRGIYGYEAPVCLASKPSF